ncbi:D-alanyl-D-alanine carboxypeptidase family protein [Hirschia baltica]|uniref:Serine-type D-Ala-D-Ala carboxypeptidase n=1 Tax=Hirschia baltica (strain ATCC 49814 / DSM 5838 / IFAM 1418) TaxID=582402 RepID=C6XL89_HIRBI|nr:D-alanyl-D-alanine carboxypeptidase family protein [Hirschia baltica]ACT59688.1 Serine-type D-Ala-D-Ala carboxypeptidase [Hirschia baltica ATCC 49814]
MAFSSAFSGLIKKLITALALSLCVIAPASAEKYASYVIDIDTAKVLHSRNADDPRFPASITKVMTLYMVFDALKAGELMLTDELKISREASKQPPSKLYLKPGETISVETAINALVTKSANDVAVVIAERLGGSETRFAALMTAKARQLGLKNTRFKNASGLPNAAQLSTAHDLAILGEAMLRDHADYYDYFSTTEFKYGRANYKNHNKLLESVRGVDGIKTGYTRASGFNLLASAERDGHRVIAVMLGGATSKSRNAHVTDLLEAAFDVIATGEDEKPSITTRIAFNELRGLTTDDLNHYALDEMDSFSTDEIDLEQGSAE